MKKTAVLYRRLGTLNTRPRRTSARQSATTWSASSQAHSGRCDVFIFARRWNSVRTYPGHSAVAVTPVPANSPASDAVNVVAHALAAA